MSQKCEVCGREVQGDLAVTQGELEDEAWVVFVYETSRRDWICCDSCNRVVCHDCCEHPKTGHCDSCMDKYNLFDYPAEPSLN